MKHMLVYLSISKIGYAFIGIIIGDSKNGYTSVITYMLFYISMNLVLLLALSYLVYIPKLITFEIKQDYTQKILFLALVIS